MLDLLEMPKEYVSQGAFGMYFQLSPSVGVKVMKERQQGESSFVSIEQLLNSLTFQKATLEQQIQRRAFKFTQRTAQPLGLRIIQDHGFFRVGLVMEHLVGRHPGCSTSEATIAQEELKEVLSHANIIHRDLNYKNIIIVGKIPYAIDFSPDCVGYEVL